MNTALFRESDWPEHVEPDEYETHRWLACAEPERPPDKYARWHVYACRGCHIKAKARVAAEPDNRHARLILALQSSDA